MICSQDNSDINRFCFLSIFLLTFDNDQVCYWEIYNKIKFWTWKQFVLCLTTLLFLWSVCVCVCCYFCEVCVYCYFCEVCVYCYFCEVCVCLLLFLWSVCLLLFLWSVCVYCYFCEVCVYCYFCVECVYCYFCVVCVYYYFCVVCVLKVNGCLQQYFPTILHHLDTEKISIWHIILIWGVDPIIHQCAVVIK